MHCRNEVFGPAIRAGWSIRTTLTFYDGARFALDAECPR
jgi:hypothetical protein